MVWYRPEKADENVPKGVRELQRALSEAMIALSGAENQLAACIERVKEARRTLEHDELVLKEIIAALTDVLSQKVVKAREYDGLRRSVRDIRRGLTQRRTNLGAARTSVDKAEDERDSLLRRVNSLREHIDKYRTVIPWKKRS